MNKRRFILSAIGVFSIAVALRLGPLYWSPLPFNPDGIGYASRALTAISTDTILLDGIATDAIGFTALLALVSTLAGSPPLYIAQPVSAVIGAATILLGIAFARRFGTGIDINQNHIQHAALFAGLLLAVEGLYLYRSMPTDEQTAGLLLVPVLGFCVDRWLRTAHLEWAGLSFVIGGVLPLLHNLSGIIGALTVTAILTIYAIKSPWPKTLLRNGLVAGIVWMWTIGYHLLIANITTAEIVQSERLITVPGLFIAWVVIAILGTGWFLTTSKRYQRSLVIGIIIISFGALGINTLRTVFVGTTQTPRGLLLVLLPLSLPLFVGALMVHHLPTNQRIGPTLIGLLSAVVALGGFSFSANLSFRYLAMAYRAQLFGHLPLLILAGTATIVIVQRASHNSVQVGVILLIVLAVSISAPVMYLGLEFLTYKGITTQAEFAATEFATHHFEAWITDDHLQRVAGYYDGNAGIRPLYRWIRLGGPPPACPVLAQQSWTTTGAQLFPRPPLQLSSDQFQHWRATNNVVYVAVSEDPMTMIIPKREVPSQSC